MTAIVHRSVPRVAGALGHVTRVSPATAHAVGCVVAFVSLLLGGIHLMDAGDWSGLTRSRALLATAQVHAAETQRALAAAQRHDPAPGSVAGRNVSATRAPAWPALMLELADLAGASGLRIVSIEPQRADDAAPDGRRTVRIVADGGFPALLRLMGGLAGLPALVVPSVLHIERKPPTARVDMTIDVFPALPGARLPGGAARMLAGASGDDPFGGAGSLTGAEDAVPRLAGTIRDARAGLALFDAGDGGFATVARGEALGAARVMRVDADAVTLATADGARRFVMDDGGRP
ncbi:TPA: pilus assembly protein [Burkholderia ambifaria]